MTIKLGHRVRDVVTGFTGIATSRIEYLTGCVQFGLVPKMGKDGKAPEVQYYDEQRLELVDAGIVARSRAGGGPQRDAPPRSG